MPADRWAMSATRRHPGNPTAADPGLLPGYFDKLVLGLAELGVAWCDKPDIETDARAVPGTANCCCEHVLQLRQALSGRFDDHHAREFSLQAA